MITADFLQKLEEHDDFISYRSVKPITIFGFELGCLGCEIFISKKIKIEEVLPVLGNYLEWLASCKNEVTAYFGSKLGEPLPDDWYKNIEVFSADITFVSLEDFGATISFGESLFPDHSIEFTIEQFEIVDDMLVG